MPKPATSTKRASDEPKTFSRVLIDESPLVFSPTLATVLGLHEAIIVQQVHYWLTRFRKDPKKADHFWDGRWWVWNSYPEWQAGNFPFWSEDTVVRYFRRCEKLGVLISVQRAPNPYDRTKSYAVDYDRLDELVAAAESGTPAPPPPDDADDVAQDVAAGDDGESSMTASCGDPSPQLSGIKGGNLRCSISETISQTTSESTATPLANAEEAPDIPNEPASPNADELWDEIPSASSDEWGEKPPKGRSKDAIERALYWVCNPQRDRRIEKSLHGQVLKYGKQIREYGDVTAEEILEQFGKGGAYYTTILAGDDPTKPIPPSPAVVYNWAFRLDNLMPRRAKPKPGDPPTLPSDDELRTAAQRASEKRQPSRPALGMLDDLLGPLAAPGVA